MLSTDFTEDLRSQRMNSHNENIKDFNLKPETKNNLLYNRKFLMPYLRSGSSNKDIEYNYLNWVHHRIRMYNGTARI